MTGILRVPRRAALIAISVLVAAASLVSFAESYRGLYDWAGEHGLTGQWQVIWPLQVDVFIAVGELALFVALADRWERRSRIGAWAVTLAGLAVSVAGNVGHVTGHSVTDRLTAAVPPLAAAAALAVGLGVLKRVVEHHQIRNSVTDLAEIRSNESPRDSSPSRDESPRDSSKTKLAPDPVPSSSFEAAKARLRFALEHGFKITDNELAGSFSLTRAATTKARQEVLAESNGHLPD